MAKTFTFEVDDEGNFTYLDETTGQNAPVVGTDPPPVWDYRRSDDTIEISSESGPFTCKFIHVNSIGTPGQDRSPLDSGESRVEGKTMTEGTFTTGPLGINQHQAHADDGLSINITHVASYRYAIACEKTVEGDKKLFLDASLGGTHIC